MLPHPHHDLTPDELAAEHDLYGPFTDTVRDLIDAALRTEVDADELHAVQSELEELVRRLRARQIPGSFGTTISSTGELRGYGNAVVGLRNAVAPPLTVLRSAEGRAWSDFRLGAAYEGPPGLVHGGVSALILDQLCGEAAAAGGAPGMTGSLTMRYRRPTPLGDLRAEAHIVDTDGVKTRVVGHLESADGLTVECEGLFILPRWARELTPEERHTGFE